MAAEDCRVLVVEDSYYMRKLIATTLTKAGYQVQSAEDGVEALKICQNHNLDAIVTDIHMPNMDGYTLIMELRQTQYFRHKPILVLTSETSKESHKQGKHLGATGWITKPFDADKLLNAMQQIRD